MVAPVLIPTWGWFSDNLKSKSRTRRAKAIIDSMRANCSPGGFITYATLNYGIFYYFKNVYAHYNIIYSINKIPENIYIS